MPPELANDQELSLKKRARRRLVGAIALVLLMVILLPMVLQDRVALAPQAAIKITMPDLPSASLAGNAVTPAAVSALVAAPIVAPPLPVDESAKADMTKDIAPDHAPDKAQEVKAPELKAQGAKASVEKLADANLNEAKLAETKNPAKNGELFSIQIGVYSDDANIKQLQAKLKDAGYTSYTEKITTAKGDKIRLRAGDYHSRPAAQAALVQMQKQGLSGMVINHE